MKKTYINFLLTLFIFLALNTQPLKGQSIKLFAGDLLNGAVNGVALGGATMALQDSGELGPLRVGVGLGILYGAGVGIYDNSIVPKGQQFYISGTFNDGRNSSIIVLLDTFYGAVGGAALGGAISLIANESILDGLQFGSGGGAWIGFGFGLIDAFVLAEGPDDLLTHLPKKRNRNHAEGLVQISPSAENINVGFLNPSLMSKKEIDGRSLKISPFFGLEILNVNVGF